MLVIAGAAWIVGYPLEQQILIWLAALVTGLGILGDLPRLIFSGLQRMQFDLITRSADKLLVVLAVASLVLLLNIHNLALLIAIMILGGTLGLILGLYFLRSQAKVQIRTFRNGSLNLLRSAAPLAGNTVIIAIYLQLPTLILSRFSQIQEVGFFTQRMGSSPPSVCCRWHLPPHFFRSFLLYSAHPILNPGEFFGLFWLLYSSAVLHWQAWSDGLAI